VVARATPFVARLCGGLRIHVATVALHLRSRPLCLHDEGQNETVALNANPRTYENANPQNCFESGEKKCHVMRRVMKITPDIRHRESV
jgi:hypothetical protein